MNVNQTTELYGYIYLGCPALPVVTAKFAIETGSGGGGGRSEAKATLLFSFSALRASTLLVVNLVLKGSV